METAEDRTVIREQSLNSHGLTEANLFDHRRSTTHTAQKARCRDALSVVSAEDEYFARTEDDESIPFYLGVLTPRQRQVLMLRYGWGNPPAHHTQGEVAERLGITQQAVAKLEAAAETRLAEHLGGIPQQHTAAL